MRFCSKTYRTKDGSLRIRFLFIDCGILEGWRAYIMSYVNYRGHSSASAVVHTIRERSIPMINALNYYVRNYQPEYRGRNYYYLCRTEKVNSLNKMISIASVWADITSYYVKNGGDYAAIQQKLARDGLL